MGFVFGTLCLVGLGMLILGGRRRRWHHRHHHHHEGMGRCGHRRHRRWHHDRYADRDDAGPQDDQRSWSSDRFVHVVKRSLDLREEQVGFVEAALRDARKAVDDFAADLRETRDDLGSAVTGDTVDDARLAAVFESHDDAVRQVRKDVVEAVKKVHAALDPEQRTRLAKLLDPAFGRWV